MYATNTINMYIDKKIVLPDPVARTVGDFPSKINFAWNFAKEPETYKKSGSGGGLYSSTSSSSSSSLNDTDDEARFYKYSQSAYHEDHRASAL
jgi:hypothetical protein